MTSIKSLSSLAFAALLVTPLMAADEFPPGSPSFKPSVESALAAAQKNGKPVVLVFSASWCPPCNAMRMGVYPSKEVQAYHDQFNWAYVDVDAPANEKAVTHYNVGPLPHIQFTDSIGRKIEHQAGASSPRSFGKTLAQILAKAAKLKDGDS